MLPTYKATLQGNQIVWDNEEPNDIKTSEPIKVYITILNDLSSIKKEPRPFGLCACGFVVLDDFDAPLPEKILRDFGGEK
jgi:hypothetical protein